MSTSSYKNVSRNCIFVSPNFSLKTFGLIVADSGTLKLFKYI